MKSLYLNAEQVRQQITALLVNNPELNEDEILRADMIEGETEAFEFLRALEAKRREACTLAAGIASTRAELDARLARMERREQSIRALLFKIMSAADLRKAELPEATLSVRNGTPKVIITDESALPQSYLRTKIEPDKSLISAALKSGQHVTGAILSNAEDTISIRTK